MGKQIFTNNAKSTLSGTLPQGGVTLVCTAGQGSRFPSPAGGDFFYLTVYTKDVYTNEQDIEVVKVTARTGDVMTVERDIESLTGNAGGYAYNGSTTTVFLELRWTAGCAVNMFQASEGALKADIALSVARTSATGSARIPVGTTAERDAVPAKGNLRYNDDLDTFEGYKEGVGWDSVGGGQMYGNAQRKAVFFNSKTIAENLTILAGDNGGSFGPITINDGFTVTVENGAVWSIV